MKILKLHFTSLLCAVFVFLNATSGLTFPLLDGIKIEGGIGVSAYDYQTINSLTEDYFYIPESCQNLGAALVISNGIAGRLQNEKLDQTTYSTCWITKPSLSSMKAISNDCKSCSWNEPSEPEQPSCSVSPIESSTIALSYGSYYVTFNDYIDSWICTKCNIDNTSTYIDAYSKNKNLTIKLDRDAAKGSKIILVGAINIKNSTYKPSLEEFKINGFKPSSFQVSYYRYNTNGYYHNLGGGARWELPVVGKKGDLISLNPLLAGGLGELVFSSIELYHAPCNLKIESLTDSNSGTAGKYPISGTITDSSGQSVNWTVTIGERTYTGTGKSPSITWDGKDSNGIPVNGTYNATLVAMTADGICSDSRSIPITVKSCDLKASITGPGSDIAFGAGGSYPITGSFTTSSAEPINWLLTLPDGTSKSGTDKNFSAIWDGNNINGTLATPGAYKATLSATSSTNSSCTASKELPIIVSPAPPGQCGLNVSFGSSAHMASGNLAHSQELFSTRGGASPVGITLYYNSLDPVNGSLGRGWSHSYDYSLTQDPDGSVLISEPNWNYRLYTPSGNGYSTQPGNYAVLTAKGSGGFDLIHRDGTLYNFNANGTLASISDRNGNTKSLAYTGSNLTAVTDPSERKIGFNYNSVGNLTSITDPSGNIYTLSVTGNTLAAVTQPDGGIWRFTTDNHGYLYSKIDPLGNTTNYDYDSRHRVISSTDPAGSRRSISYPTDDGTVRNTAFTEKDGGVWSYSYDTQKGYLLAKTDPQGGTTSYGYDANGNRTSTTNPDATTTNSTYDYAGNMTSATDALGQTTSYSYNSFGQITGIIDPQGGTTAYVYDAKGNMTSVTDPTGAITSYSYDSKGNPTKVTNPAGQATIFSYDGKGNLTSIADPAGATTRYAYDATGNVTSITDTKDAVTQLVYDARNRLIKVIDPQGNATSYSYDTNGNKLSETDANGNVTHFEYNSRNQLIKTIDAIGSVTTYAYGGSSCPSCGGGVDKLSAITDANGNITSYLYDQLGRAVREADPLGNNIAFAYDARNNPISKTDASGNTINYSYDANGRLIKKIFPDGSEETFSYDAKGNLLTAISKHISYTFNYDAAGRMLSAADSKGKVISYEYDLTGNKTKMISPEGKSITYIYDKANRLTSIINGGTFSFGYDNMGQRTSLTYPNGDTATYGYDKQGRLASLVRKNSAGTIISSNSYTLDKVGNRQTNTTLDRTNSYNYDAVYRLTQALTNTPGYSTNSKATKGTANAVQQQKDYFTYDPVGNRLASANNKSYAYGPANQLINENGTAYSYDKNGNLTQKATATEVTTYIWDFENRLIKATTPSTTSEYAYDPFGRRIEKKVTESGATNTTMYFYDNQAILFDYDETGTIGNRYIHGPNIDEPLAVTTNKDKYYYHADGLGSIIALTDQLGKVVQDYEYDSFGNLKDQKNRVKQPFTYTGREWDKETGLYYYRARYYDPMEGRFIQKDPIGFRGGINLYSYVGQNPVNWIDPSGLLAEVVIWQPVGWGGSSFGHVSTNLNGTTYSYGPQGMSTMSTSDYLNRNSFRDGVGAVLNLTPSQEASLQACLSESQGNYSSVNNNCGSPIQRCLNRFGVSSFRDLLPVSFGNSLSNSGLVNSYNIYNATTPANGSSAPWAR